MKLSLIILVVQKKFVTFRGQLSQKENKFHTMVHRSSLVVDIDKPSKIFKDWSGKVKLLTIFKTFSKFISRITLKPPPVPNNYGRST